MKLIKNHEGKGNAILIVFVIAMLVFGLRPYVDEFPTSFEKLKKLKEKFNRESVSAYFDSEWWSKLRRDPGNDALMGDKKKENGIVVAEKEEKLDKLKKQDREELDDLVNKLK